MKERTTVERKHTDVLELILIEIWLCENTEGKQSSFCLVVSWL